MNKATVLILHSYFSALVANEQRIRTRAEEGEEYILLDCLEIATPMALRAGWCSNLRVLVREIGIMRPELLDATNYTRILTEQNHTLVKLGLDPNYPVSVDTGVDPEKQYQVSAARKWGTGRYADRRWELIKMLNATLAESMGRLAR